MYTKFGSVKGRDISPSHSTNYQINPPHSPKITKFNQRGITNHYYLFFQNLREYIYILSTKYNPKIWADATSRMVFFSLSQEFQDDHKTTLT